jgi:hypothetical protein
MQSGEANLPDASLSAYDAPDPERIQIGRACESPDEEES